MEACAQGERLGVLGGGSRISVSRSLVVVAYESRHVAVVRLRRQVVVVGKEGLPLVGQFVGGRNDLGLRGKCQGAPEAFGSFDGCGGFAPFAGKAVHRAVVTLRGIGILGRLILLPRVFASPTDASGAVQESLGVGLGFFGIVPRASRAVVGRRIGEGLCTSAASG